MANRSTAISFYSLKKAKPSSSDGEALQYLTLLGGKK
jgi:hypothetical protein